MSKEKDKKARREAREREEERPALTQKEVERLERLQKDKLLSCPPSLTVSDLLLLLREDTEVHKLVRRIVGAAPIVEAEAEEAAPEEAREDEPWEEIPAEEEEEEEAAPASLRESLQAELDFLALARADAEISGLWLGKREEEDEGRQLVRLIATASQWQNVQRLWDILAERCKEGKRPAVEAERALLQHSVDLHNLIWKDRTARLSEARAGEAFDFQKHTRCGTPAGDVIAKSCLPGLVAANGETARNPLVTTRK
jgi:hypothetical protein